MHVKPDIQSRSDIEKLVKIFYEKILADALLAPIFLKVANIDLSQHLAIQYDFWESVLFQVGKYKRDTLAAHLELHQLHRLNATYFDRWLALFNETVDDFFEGKKATQAKERALTITAFIKTKINHWERRRLELNN